MTALLCIHAGGFGRPYCRSKHFGIESPDDQPSTVIEILKKEVNKQPKFQEMIVDMVKKCEPSNLAYSCQTKEEHP